MIAPDELPIFEFETDFAGSLRCIPMAVRFKLDHAGIKLSLNQWCRFTADDRQQLLTLPCRTAADIQRYQRTLIELIATKAHEQAKHVVVEADPEWARTGRVPPRVVDHSHQLGVDPPTGRQWAGMTPLQRFALLKLTREGHDNANFIPALREFSAVPA